MAYYRFLFCDLVTSTFLGELEVDSVRYGRVLNGAGKMEGAVAISDPKVVAKNPLDLTAPTRRKVYVERDGVIEWGGTIWGRNFDDSREAMVLEISAIELWANFRSQNEIGRYVTDDLSWVQQDQLAIFRDLVAYAQGQQLSAVVGAPKTFPKPGGSLGIVLGSEASGVLRDLTYEDTSYQEIADAAEQLAGLEHGFDFSIDSAYLGSAIVDTLMLSYPRRGVSVQAGTSPRILQKPGNIRNYTWPEDGTMLATTAFAIGDGEGSSMLRSVAARPDLIDAGYPLRELRRSYKGQGITAQSTLDSHALADVNAHAAASALPSIEFVPDARCPIGAFTTGDDLHIMVHDDRFPSPGYAGADQRLDTYFRLISYEVTAPRGTDQETVKGTFGVIT